MADLKNIIGLARVEVAFIGETVKPDEQKTFIKREIAFKVYESVNGNEYERLYCMQAVGSTDKPQFDKTKLLDNYKVGDIVNVVYSISGSTKKNEKLQPTPNNPGCLTGFNNLTISRIERPQMQQPQYGQQQPGYQNNMSGSNYPQPQQGGYQPQPNVQQNNPPAANTATSFFPQPAGEIPTNPDDGQPMVWNTKTGVWEKLPF